MPHDVFISYSTKDKPVADKVCAGLEVQGIACWMAPRDIQPGVNWAGAILDAIGRSQAMIVLLTRNAVDSNQIEHEVERAHSRNIPLIALSLQQVALERSLALYLPASQWLDAGSGRLEAHLDKLADAIHRIPIPNGQSRPEKPALQPVSPALALFRRRRRPLIAALSLILIAGAAIATWLLWPAPHWTVESSRPFISTLALEGEPAFSPDGKMLAYTSGPDPLSRKIYVRSVANGDAIKVTGDGYSDVSPAWSPDGTRIVYVATKPGEPCRIMVTGVPAGEAREVGRCAHAATTSVSWQPGTSFLYYFDQAEQTPGFTGRLETDFILRLNLDSGEQLKLPKKSANPILGMRHLQCSPDGRSLLFLGRENAFTDALLIRDLASGEERLLGKIIISGSAAWSEDSRTVLTATGSGIGSEITAYPVGGGAPYHVFAATINVSHLATGAGGLLALETDPGRQNLARASARPAAQPDIIDPTNGRSWAPTFAPDGTLAFLSNRSGTNAIWVMKPGAAPAMLYDAGLLPMFRLEFSPDGTRLAAPVAGEHGVTVNVLSAGGANVASFHSPTLGGGAPTWTPDSKEVVLFDKDMPAYVGVDIANTAHRRPIVPSPWGAVIFHNNATFAARFDKPGYWQFDKNPRLVTGKYPNRWDPPPTLRGDDLLIPDFNAPGGPRILAQPLAGGPDRVLAYAPGAQAQLDGLMSKMAVNPKTGEIVYVAAVQSDTNIDLLTLAKR